MRCTQQTVSRLVRYFEDVVTENTLSALVIEGRCLSGEAGPEKRRLETLAAAARHVYLVSCPSQCSGSEWQPEADFKLTTLAENDYHETETGPFILVMEPRFCGLLASCEVPDDRNPHVSAYDLIWTFDPNVVFTAIEYLMSRVTVQTPQERHKFETLVSACTPHSSSLKLALSFTTKVTLLMQRQNELEMATNRISSAISSSLEIESILQSAVEEVGRTLRARRAALVLWEEGTNMPEGMSIYERPDELNPDTNVLDCPLAPPCPLEVPITYRNSVIGSLLIEDDTASRDWEDEEVLMVKTVCDQLSVAISHARLFRKVQTQAMTDALTGLHNYGYFQERLDRETKLADRNNDQVSLILLDLDHLKRTNDTHGHRAGDVTLRHVASIMKRVVRDVDVCARYGGEEFVVILTQCDREKAMEVAERLRESIASSPVNTVGQVTASIGVATYPTGAKNQEELVEMADRAMYLAKAAGRNRVRTLAHRDYSSMDVK